MRTSALVVLTVILVLAVPVLSHASPIEVDILSDNGRQYLSIPFKDYSADGTQITKKYLEAVKGRNYTIAIRNNLPERIGVVIAVDGRNIISGRKSYLKQNERMYIIEPYGQSSFEGWRTDMKTVHRFYFTSEADSYSARTFDDSSAMGVIAVAVFREKPRPQALKKERRAAAGYPGDAPAPARSENKAAESDSAGTGFGQENYAPAVEVQFEPWSVPVQKVIVKYEWHDVLCKKGLINCHSAGRNRLWHEEFAPIPPNYPR